MSLIRKNAEGAQIIIPDGNITRKLNALAKLDKNRVNSGLTVANMTGPWMFSISAGTAVVGGNYTEFVGVPTIIATSSPTASPYTTVYIASGMSAPTYKVSAAVASYPPGSAQFGHNSYVILAHLKANVGTYTVDNQVKPKLFSDNVSWDKRAGF